MNEVCGDYVIINPYVWLPKACVRFNTKIKEIYVVSRDLEKSDKVRIITHGMATTHIHLGLYPIRNTVVSGLNLDEWVRNFVWGWERFLRENPEVSYYASLLAIRELLSSGVTTFADMHVNEDMVYKAVLESGVKADLSTPIMDGGIYENYEEALEENLRLLKIVSEPRVRVRLGPCTPRLLSPAAFKEVVELAKERGLGIHTHLAEVFEDLAWLKNKYSMTLRDFIKFVGLTEVNAIVAHAVWAEEAVNILSSSNFIISHAPRSNVLLGDGRAPIKNYLKKQSNVTIGIDVAPTYDIREDLRAYTLLHYEGEGIPDLQEAFRLVTTTAYRSMGFGKGELIEGEEADIVVWSVKNLVPGNPVAQISWGDSHVEEVYVSGVLVFSGGELKLARTPSEEIREVLNNYLTEFFE
ncbi:MAG: amidohydrolase family protein [Desulfurococcaceae archaeon TW002]